MALADIYQAVAEQLADETVKFGEKALAENDSPPKVTFVPQEFSFRSGQSSGRWPRSILTRRQRVDIHCWAADDRDHSAAAQFRAAEALADKVLWAVHRAAVGSYELGAGTPIDDSVSNRGRILVVSVFFLLPVVETEEARSFTQVPILDVSTGADLPVVGTPAAVTGVAVFGPEGSETEIEGSPAP